MRRLYIATPINGRKGHSFQEKLNAAYDRICLLKSLLRDNEMFEGYELTSTFDIHDDGIMPTEAEAMGDCIAEVLSCDAIYLDHGWLQSKGCRLEHSAAKIYGLRIYEHDRL